MGLFNYYGLVFIAIIIIPNIIFAIKNKGQFANTLSNKPVIILEQVARVFCIFFMVFNIPYTYIGFYLTYGLYLYLIINSLLVVAYCFCWIVFWKKDGIVKNLLLSLLPTIIFVFSGIIIASIPLIVFAVIFAVAHIYISVKNVKVKEPFIKRKVCLTITSIILSFVIAFGCTFGGATLYKQNEFVYLANLSAIDAIKYCCTGETKISVAIIENGNITTHTYGSDGEESVVYDYEIGSISKTFVALLCAKAVDEGKLDLQDSIRKYLNLNEDKYYPTIERLLTHTSGYSAYYFENSMISNKFAQISNDFYSINRQSILNKVKSVTLEDRDYPFNYSNFGISVVGLVLESIYGDTFTNILNDYMRGELALPSTIAASQSGNLSGYWKWKQDDGYIPAGSIISNINDMASYLNLYMTDKIPYAATTYLPLKQLNATSGLNEKYNVRIDSIGMTWILDDVNGIVWHNGATTNFNSYMGFNKDKSKGVVILSNLNSNDKISMTVLGAKLLIC